MPLKAPGNITGLYYIPVAGLPWNTTWKTLKDFVRKHPDGTSLDVERAHVYQNNGVAATDGYVCIRGSEHFHKAITFLQGARLENQCLMVIGTNENCTINLRDDELPLPIDHHPSKTRQGSKSRRHRQSSCSAASPSLKYTSTVPQQWPARRQSTRGSSHDRDLAVAPRIAAAASYDSYVPMPYSASYGYGQVPPSPTWSEAYSQSPDDVYGLSPVQHPPSPSSLLPSPNLQYQSSLPSSHPRAPSRLGTRSATPQIAHGSYTPATTGSSTP